MCIYNIAIISNFPHSDKCNYNDGELRIFPVAFGCYIVHIYMCGVRLYVSPYI